MCNVKDAQNYTWYKDNKRILLPRVRYYVKTDRYLRITNVVKSDSGVFVCVASNSYGSVNCTIRLIVEGMICLKKFQLQQSFKIQSYNPRQKCSEGIGNFFPPLPFSVAVFISQRPLRLLDALNVWLLVTSTTARQMFLGHLITKYHFSCKVVKVRSHYSIFRSHNQCFNIVANLDG